VREKSLIWLTRVNGQVHSTTNQIPAVLFSEEKKVLKTFVGENVPEKRSVDKTGLISYKSNKYSVPYQYQQKVVFISIIADNLIISDIKTNTEICRWKISSANGVRNINNNHYRDYEESLSKVKEKCLEKFKNIKDSDLLIEKILTDNPKIRRDQLCGLLSVYNKNTSENWSELTNLLLQLQSVRVSVIEKIIEDNKKKNEIVGVHKKCEKTNKSLTTSKLDRSLDKYDEVCR